MTAKDMEAVSKALRRKTTKTAEMYCARIRVEDAFRDLEAVFADYDVPENGSRTKTP